MKFEKSRAKSDENISTDDELTVRWYPADTKFVPSKSETDDGIYRTFIKVIRTTVLESES